MDTCFVSNYSSSNRQNCRMTMSLMTCMCLNHINFRKIRGKTMNIYFESKRKKKSILNARVALHHPSLRFPLGVLAWAVCCIYRYKSHHPWGSSGHGCSIGHIGSSQLFSTVDASINQREDRGDTSTVEGSRHRPSKMKEGTANCVDILIAIILPPLGVFLKFGCKVLLLGDSPSRI